MEKKITKRDMFEAIKGLAESGALHMADFNEAITDDMVIEFFDNEIALLDKKAVKAKENAAKKKAADELYDIIVNALTDDYQTIADIVAVIDNPEVTVSKATYRLSKAVENNVAEKTQVVIPATETSKARKVMAYRISQ